jgi:oxidase EvaA
MIKSNLTIWLNEQKNTQKISVTKIKLNSLKKWKFTKKEIFHTSKKFFKIIGIRVVSNFYKTHWDQPIIFQNEIGILGIIKNLKTKKYLLQAKVEPGNINKIQISPSVQATKSNYTRVHGGKVIPYLNYFKEKNKNFSLQSEQAFRYFNKLNSNIIALVSKKLVLDKSFRWFSKKELINLLYKKNLINMDTLSVFSCFIKKNKIDYPLNSLKSVFKWSSDLNKRYFLKTKIIKISSLRGWLMSKGKLRHKKNNFFSVIGIKIKTNHREINEWSQPIIQGSKLAFAGFILKKFNNTKHYLCRYILKPGSKKNTFSCSVNTSNLNSFKKNINLTSFQKKLISNYFLSNRYKKIYNNLLSDEGGRFYHSQIKYTACELKKNEHLNLPFNYIWLSTNQIIDLIKKRQIDIEARLLFGILNFEGTF